MEFNVGRIPGQLRIDPDAGGKGQQRKRENSAPKRGAGDSVSISDEAKRRSHEEEAGDCETG